MFAIVHKDNPLKKIYTGKTRADCWGKFYEAENTFADNRVEFRAHARMQGYKCCKVQ